MSTANPRYLGKSLPVAIPVPPVRRVPPIIRPVKKPVQAVAQAVPPELKDFIGSISRPPIQTSRNKIISRKCGCCGEEISRTATRCPYCQYQSRSKGAAEARKRVRLGAVLLIISPLAIIYTCISAWPKGEFFQALHSSANARGYDFDIGRGDYPWHEKVSDPVVSSPSNNAVEVMVRGIIGSSNRYHLEFSFKKFLISVQGWIVISNCIVIVCSISMIKREERRAKYCSK